MGALEAVDASVLLGGPRHHLIQGPWPTREHWLGLRERADALGRPVCVVNAHWAAETPPPELWRPGDQYLWLNAIDGPFPALRGQWVNLVGLQTAAAVDAGYVTYVHCLAGVSRSTLVAAAALVALQGGTYARAANFVARCRPAANPCPAFLAVMDELDRRLVADVVEVATHARLH